MATRPKKPQTQAQQYTDEKGASIILDIALPTLRKWRHERRGPSYVKIQDSRMVRYSIDSLNSFMNRNRIDLEG